MKTGLSKFFNELLYEAELNRQENSDPDSVKAAYDFCGEEPETRSRIIEDLRALIQERQECHPPRTDDAFLLRFLRAKMFIPSRAHKLLVRYCNFRENNPQLFRDLHWLRFTRLGSIFQAVLYDRPDVGRLLIISLSKWDPDVNSAEDIVSAVLFCLEIGAMQPKMQILGGTIILDCEGLSMRQVRSLSPSIMPLCFNLLGHAFPLRLRELHIINISAFFRTLIPVFLKLAPSDFGLANMHIHGYDITSLHRYIDPECLPTKYGGKHDLVSTDVWLNKIKQYKDEQFDHDLKVLGYATEEFN